MPGQSIRKRSVKQKLNPIEIEFKDKNVLLVDDSIVRGHTSKKIIEMVKHCGAKKVYLLPPPLSDTRTSTGLTCLQQKNLLLTNAVFAK